MRRFEYRRHISATAEQAWDFSVVHQPENHPKWEKEVVEVRRDPLQLGARGVMVRREWGRTFEAPFEIAELVPGRRIAYRSGAGGFRMYLEFDFVPAAKGCELVVRNTLRLEGALRLLWPVLWFVHPARSRRISDCFAEAIANAAPAA